MTTPLLNDTNEGLYQAGREQAFEEDTSRARMLATLDSQPTEQPGVSAPPPPERQQNDVWEGLDYAVGQFKEASWQELTTGATKLAGLFGWSMLKDTGSGLRAAYTPVEAVQNAGLAAVQGESPLNAATDTFKATAQRTIQEDPPARRMVEKIMPNSSPEDKMAAEFGITIVTDPLMAGGGGRLLAKGVQRVLKGTGRTPFTAGVQSLAEVADPGSAHNLLTLARQADGGSKRAARMLSQVVDSSRMAPLMEQWAQNNIRKDFSRLLSIGGRGIPTPKKAKTLQTQLTVTRREGSPTLLIKEMDAPIASHFKHSTSYLNINSPKDVESFTNVYLRETESYLAQSMARATPEQKVKILESLPGQKATLQNIIGDKINLNVTPEQAFGYRRMLADLGANIRQQIHGTEMKFKSNIDRIRFYKLVGTREQVRANLSLSTTPASSLTSMLSTKGSSKGVIVEMADRAVSRIPELSPKMERALGYALKNLNDGDQVNIFLNQSFGTEGWNALEKGLHKYWLNSLLSSPVTHNKNLTANALTALSRPVDELGAAAVSVFYGPERALDHLRAARGQMTGLIEGTYDLFRVMAGHPSTGPMNAQQFKGMHEASSFQPKLSPEALAQSPAITRGWHYVSDMLPTEFLGKADSWFKSVNARADLHAQALDTASRLSKDPAIRQQIARALKNDPLELSKVNAFRSAEVSTFQNPLPESWAGAVSALNKFRATKWVVPFVKTPANLIAFGTKRTPFGILFKDVQADIAKGGSSRDLALARLTLPTMTGLAAVSMLDDKVTGKNNQRTRLNQLPEYSINIGGEWVSYKGIEPLRWVLGPMANLRDVFVQTDWDSLDGQETATEALSGFVGAYMKPLLDNFFLFQMANVMDSVRRFVEDGTGQGISNYMQQVGAGMIPNAVTFANRAMLDNNIRELDTFTSRLMNRIPGLSDNLPPKVGLLGEPQQHLFQNPASDHQAYDQIRLTGAKVPDVAKVYQGVQLNAVQRANLRQFRAYPQGLPPLAEGLDILFQTPTYNRTDNQGKGEYIQDIISRYNSQAISQLVATDTELRESLSLAQQKILQRQGR